MLLECCPALRAQQSSAATERERLVFAHYMLTSQDYQGDTDPTQEAKIAAYEREIQQAQSIGIDGFALNAGGWRSEPYYVKYAAQMFEAAIRLHSGFKLFFSADLCCKNDLADVEDMMRRFAVNPYYARVYLRRDGKPVLSTFAGDKFGQSGWRGLRRDLATGEHPSLSTFPAALPEARGAPSNQPMDIFFVPAFLWKHEVPSNRQIRSNFAHWSNVFDGYLYWGIAGVPGSHDSLDLLRASDDYASTAHDAHKLYMAPVCLQFWGSNADRYYEYSGYSGMRKMWMDAIDRSHPEWIELITWNDFIEATYVSPIDDPNRYQYANYLVSSGIPTGTLHYFHSHAGAFELLRFFISWYKTGVQPVIERDAVYWAYRTQPANYDAGKPSVRHRHGPVADMVYITANLIAAAQLTVVINGKAQTISLAAGTSDAEVPFTPGPPPVFELRRDGEMIARGEGADPIDADPRYNNFYYSTGMMAADARPKQTAPAAAMPSIGAAQ